jgi:hypothetical protein
MVSLLISLVSSRIFNGIRYETINDSILGEFIIKYICDNNTIQSPEFRSFYNISSSIGLIENFGDMMKSMWIKSGSENIRFIHTFNVKSYRHISKLYITDVHKIAVSLPYIPLATQYSTHDVYKLNKDNTIQDLKNKQIPEEYWEKYNNYNTFIVEYINPFATSTKGIQSALTQKKYIISTNRYSKTFGVVKSYIYEYDNIDDKSDTIKSIIEFISSTVNSEYLKNEISTYNILNNLVLNILSNSEDARTSNSEDDPSNSEDEPSNSGALPSNSGARPSNSEGDTSNSGMRASNSGVRASNSGVGASTSESSPEESNDEFFNANNNKNNKLQEGGNKTYKNKKYNKKIKYTKRTRKNYRKYHKN